MLKQNTIKTCRIQYKLQTDGYYSGNPSVFVELFGCNLKCPKLNAGQEFEKPKHYETQEQVDTGLIHSGCDHAHAHDTDFFYLANRDTLDELVDKIHNALPNRSWVLPSGKPVHLVFTGGEPMLHQKVLKDVLTKIDYHSNIEKRKPLSYVTIETNCTLPIESDIADYFKEWEKNTKYIEDFKREILFANSPKLSNSGENIECLTSAMAISSQLENLFKCTFKFVCPPEKKYFNEIESYFSDVMAAFQEDELDPIAIDEFGHRLRKALVYISHEAANRDQIDYSDLRKLGQFCLEYGYILTLRNHLFWG